MDDNEYQGADPAPHPNPQSSALSTPPSAVATPLREWLVAYGATPAPDGGTWAEALVAAVWAGACRGQAPMIKLLLDASEAAASSPMAWLDDILRKMDAEDAARREAAMRNEAAET